MLILTSFFNIMSRVRPSWRRAPKTTYGYKNHLLQNLQESVRELKKYNDRQDRK